MANVKKCDICGGIFDDCNKDTGLNLEINGLRLDDERMLRGGFIYPRKAFTFDCCPVCTEKLITEMANMNGQGNGMSFLSLLYEGKSEEDA